jgi:hypothetical protein
MRWLGGLTGAVTLVGMCVAYASCAAAAVGFAPAVWWGSAFLGPILLLVGACLSGGTRQAGKWLMGLGALLATPVPLFYSAAGLIAWMPGWGLLWSIVIAVAAATTILLVVSTDVALVVGAVRGTRHGHGS